MFERVTTENFPKLMSDIKPQIQDVQRTPGRINAQNRQTDKPESWPIIFKLQRIKGKRKILKEHRAGKKHLACKGTKIITFDFSSEIM